MWIDDIFGNFTVFHNEDLGGASNGNLVETIASAYHQRALTTAGEGVRHRLHLIFEGTANQACLRACWIRQRPQQVEDCRNR